MLVHRFRPGQVRNVSGGARQPVPPGRYEIIRGLPEADAELQYRIKSLENGREWVIKESHLS